MAHRRIARAYAAVIAAAVLAGCAAPTPEQRVSQLLGRSPHDRMATPPELMLDVGQSATIRDDGATAVYTVSDIQPIPASNAAPAGGYAALVTITGQSGVFDVSVASMYFEPGNTDGTQDRTVNSDVWLVKPYEPTLSSTEREAQTLVTGETISGWVGVAADAKDGQVETIVLTGNGGYDNWAAWRIKAS